MQTGEERSLTIREFFNLSKEGGSYEIETPEGWVPIQSLVEKQGKECLSVQTDKDKILQASGDHLVLCEDKWIFLSNLLIGDQILTIDGHEQVISIEKIGTHNTLDLEVGSENQWYYSNGIVSHNTGKTAIARAIAEELDMPLFVYALGHMLDEELERSWAEMQAHIPCVALFEDFDNVFHGRENVYGKATLAEMLNTTGPTKDPTKDPTVAKEQTGILNIGRLSFDCLLNCLDGVEKSNGVFTIITTNHIDKLDEAMGRPRKNPDGTTEFISTRPGRIDKAIELTYMTDGDKLRLAKRIFFDNERTYHKMVALIEKEPNKQETPAQFQERCAQMALELLWKSEHEIEEKICSNGNHKFFPKPFSAANV